MSVVIVNLGSPAFISSLSTVKAASLLAYGLVVIDSLRTPTESEWHRRGLEFARMVEASTPSLTGAKLESDRRAGAVKIPVVPRLRWTGAKRIAGMDIRRFNPRQQRL